MTGARRAALALLASAPLLAPPAGAARWHFEAAGTPPFAYSLLFTREATGDTTRLLIETRGILLELASAQDPAGNDSTESATDAATKERFARRLVLSGHEAVPACAGVRAPDACVVFSGARGSLAAGLSAFAGEGAPALRAKVAALVTPALDATLSALAPVFPKTAELMAYGDDFLRLVWPDRFPKGTGIFEKGRRTPGCDFDARFGYPCSEAERRRDTSLAR